MENNQTNEEELYLKLTDFIPIKGYCNYVERTQKTSFSENWSKLLNRYSVLAVANAVTFIGMAMAIREGLEALVK